MAIADKIRALLMKAANQKLFGLWQKMWAKRIRTAQKAKRGTWQLPVLSLSHGPERGF